MSGRRDCRRRSSKERSGAELVTFLYPGPSGYRAPDGGRWRPLFVENSPRSSGAAFKSTRPRRAPDRRRHSPDARRGVRNHHHLADEAFRVRMRSSPPPQHPGSALPDRGDPQQTTPIASSNPAVSMNPDEPPPLDARVLRRTGHRLDPPTTRTIVNSSSGRRSPESNADITLASEHGPLVRAISMRLARKKTACACRVHPRDPRYPASIYVQCANALHTLLSR